MRIFDAIGNTPLVEIKSIWDSDKTGVRILAKLEGSNPGGSVKDRPAYYMINNAVKSGILTPEKTILEPTSGNTGIGLAMIASAMGQKIKLVMPECVSGERRAVLLAYGAELVLSPGCEKTDGAIMMAHKILESDPEKYYMPNQFENPANFISHYETTAPEILRDTNGDVSVFVAGMGTTGTLMGCSKYFRDNDLKIKVVGIEPEINHRIQGLKNMNEAIVPKIYNQALLDLKLKCTDEDAFNIVRLLAVREGIFSGLSSGASMHGAMMAASDLPRGSTVVVIFPDRGDRYLSTNVFTSKCALCPP